MCSNTNFRLLKRLTFLYGSPTNKEDPLQPPPYEPKNNGGNFVRNANTRVTFHAMGVENFNDDKNGVKKDVTFKETTVKDDTCDLTDIMARVGQRPQKPRYRRFRAFFFRFIIIWAEFLSQP